MIVHSISIVGEVVIRGSGVVNMTSDCDGLGKYECVKALEAFESQKFVSEKVIK